MTTLAVHKFYIEEEELTGKFFNCVEFWRGKILSVNFQKDNDKFVVVVDVPTYNFFDLVAAVEKIYE